MYKKIQDALKYFSAVEYTIWITSVLLILIFFAIFSRESYLSLAASLIGVTSLIFNAKGNPFGQILMILFSILYGFISYSFSYYGEMITYLGMTAPMALFALISWLRNPYKGNKAQVKINRIKIKEWIFMIILTCIVTVLFYFILSYFKTANLFFSTLSITTSFIAAYLTLRRSAFFAAAYAANDIILIILWSLASITDKSYVSVIICFAVFLINDIYGFINWLKMSRKQADNI